MHSLGAFLSHCEAFRLLIRLAQEASKMPIAQSSFDLLAVARVGEDGVTVSTIRGQGWVGPGCKILKLYVSN